MDNDLPIKKRKALYEIFNSPCFKLMQRSKYQAFCLLMLIICKKTKQNKKKTQVSRCISSVTASLYICHF